ncbi:response regulator [Hyphococcus sp.]|uniref:response regulator n=1 Tax=Hyphococcus sp. TaxID=2038636 RepID=UPI003CCB84C5
MDQKKKILIADDDLMLLKALTRRFEALNLDVRTVTDGIDAVTSVHADPPDLIVLDIDMPAANGFTVYEKLLTNDNYRHIPVIFLTGLKSEKVVARCAQFSAGYVLKDAETWENLIKAVTEILSVDAHSPSPAVLRRTPAQQAARSQSAGTILAVDDDPDILRVLQLQCEAVGLHFVSARGPNEGFIKALQIKPDVILSDYLMPDGTGLYFIQRLRTSSATSHIPVIILTGETLDGTREDADLVMRVKRQDGVIAYLNKPLEFDVLHKVLSKSTGLPVKPLTAQTRRAALPRQEKKRLFGG